MTIRSGVIVGWIVGLLIMTASTSFAAELRFQVRNSDTIKSILESELGKEVKVKLTCGEEMSGTIVEVGEWVVHLASLSGREFYDAAIRLDQISAVIVKAREK
jgi:hypothetical protein